MSFERFTQWYIGVVGGLGFFLIANKNPWGFLLTLSTEPFWFYSTWQKRQWGMFALTLLYTVSCCIGIDQWFFSGACWHTIKNFLSP